MISSCKPVFTIVFARPVFLKVLQEDIWQSMAMTVKVQISWLRPPPNSHIRVFRLFLKERLSVASIAAVLLMLAGVLSAVQPWHTPTNPEDGYR